MHSPYTRLVRKAHAWLSEADKMLASGQLAAEDLWQHMSQQARLAALADHA